MSFGLLPKVVTGAHDYLKWDGTLFDGCIRKQKNAE
jgi:hypothetical protein